MMSQSSCSSVFSMSRAICPARFGCLLPGSVVDTVHFLCGGRGSRLLGGNSGGAARALIPATCSVGGGGKGDYPSSVGDFGGVPVQLQGVHVGSSFLALGHSPPSGERSVRFVCPSVSEGIAVGVPGQRGRN